MALPSVRRSLPLIIIFITGVMLTQSALAQHDTLNVNVEGAIQRSLTVSPEVNIKEAQQHHAEARYDQAQASRFLTEFEVTTGHAAAPGLTNFSESTPERESHRLYLNPNVDNDWNDPRLYNQIEYEALQPIWTWGQLGGSIEAAEHGVDVEAADTRSKSLEVSFRTGKLYYNVLLTEELHRLTEKTGSVLERAKTQIDTLLQQGAEDVDRADLFQVRITEQEYNQRVVEVRQRRKTARMALRRQLFLPDSTLALPKTLLLRPLTFDLQPLQQYLDLALTNRPEIEQAKAGLAARNAQVEVARSDYYPKLFLRVDGGARYAPGRPKQKNAYIGDSYRGSSLRAGLGFRQKLNFFQTEAKVEQAEAKRNEVRYQREAARQLALAETEEAYRDVITKQAALQARDKALNISKNWLRTEQVNFDLDLGSTENLVKAVRQNLQLQAGYYEAVKNYNVAVLKLLRVTGVLARRAQSGTLVDDS